MGSHLQNRLRTGSQAPVRLQHAAGLPHRLPHQPGHGHEGLRDDAPAGPRHLRTDATGRPGGRAAQLTVRGLYGEGTEATGNLFQISNQTTLGDSEDQIVERMTRFTSDLAHQEWNARRRLLQASSLQVKDRVSRAYGLLTNATPAIHAGGAGAALLPPDGSIPGHLFPPGIKKRQ